MYAGDHLSGEGGGARLKVCFTLGPAAQNPSRAGEMAIATRGDHVAVVQANGEILRLKTHSDGPVNCAIYHPEGDSLLLGIGFYPLGGGRELWEETARIEVWDVQGGAPFCSAVVPVPGVCVDSLDWGLRNGELFCASGTRSQKRGFITVLEFPSMVARGYLEIHQARNHSLSVFREYDWPEDDRGDPPFALVTNSSQAFVHSFRTGEARWGQRIDRQIGCATCDRDRLTFLSDGRIVDSFTGKGVGGFEELEECCSLAFDLDAYCLWGVSNRGLLRRWNVIHEMDQIV
jgi:hypothetical protein